MLRENPDADVPGCNADGEGENDRGLTATDTKPDRSTRHRLSDRVPANTTYFVLTVCLLLVPLQKLNLDGAVRARVAVITGLAVLGYLVTMNLIFFLIYTPLDVDHVRGVQGRYLSLLCQWLLSSSPR